MVILLIGGTSFVAWFFSMLAGGGSPLILIPLLSLLLGTQAVAPVITTGLLIGNTQRSLFFWKEIDWKVTSWYLPGCLAGAVFGAYIFTRLQVDWLQILIGIALLGMVLNYWLSRLFKLSDRKLTVKAWYFLPVAFLNAVGSALIGSTGPIMNPMYFAYGLEKEAMVATKASNKAFLHVIKLISYAVLGVLEPSYLGYGLLIGLGAMPANWLGKWVLERMTNDQFRQMVFAFVAVSGVMMIWEQRNWLLVW
ncbi:MAG: sulfite exporter TauE/SafE family protein [Leptolyngbya sp. SIO1D8]|nr:sulfite exporter TauE/SafE family protein [Leptolyngbya sp. SIO1D8]